jgi:hypothetical protein
MGSRQFVQTAVTAMAGRQAGHGAHVQLPGSVYLLGIGGEGFQLRLR